MNKNFLSGIAATTFVASLAFAAPASAAVTFDPVTGTGFVGKGDVQQVFVWSNAELQKSAGQVSFATESAEVTEVSWECTNQKNEKIQERARTTSTSKTALVSHIARDNKKQITGFKLTGPGQVLSSSSTTEGPAVNSCPAGQNDKDPNFWNLSTEAGAPEVVSLTVSLSVSDGVDTHNLPF